MRLLVFLTTLLFGYASHGQQSFVDKIFPLQENPILQEKVFIHTNKTSYLTDDTIWFKAYVGDTINYPSIETSKLYVNLLDAKGAVVYQKNIHIDEGTGQGEFELNSAVGPGKYYIQAYTNYMRNFGEDYHYVQELEVLGEADAETEGRETKYDVQLLPESGYLLEGTENILGIKTLINGRGAGFSGKIMNSKGLSVASFKDEHLGMARCKFFYKKGEQYHAAMTINDTLLDIELPRALKKGIVLHTDNSDETYFNVALKTNEATFYDQVYSNYTLLFHQGHQIYGLVAVSRLDSTLATIKTDKNVFLDGVNTVTLFEDDRPIAERKFFIEKDYKQVTAQLDKLNTDKDSVTYKLRLSRLKEPVRANLSISVLFENTQAYTEKQNIRSAFLLTSLLKGNVENPAYYFDHDNPKRKEHLDLLLLTQGWSQYSLKEMIRELNPRPRFKFEYGIDIAGALEGPVLHNRLALVADDYQIIDKVNLRGDRRFQFNKMLLFNGDTVKVSYLNWRGKLIRPDSIRFDDTKKKNDSFPKWIAQEIPRTPESNENEPLQYRAPLRPEQGTIVLDEVTLTERKLNQRMIEKRKLVEKYKPMVFDIGKYYDLPVPENFEDTDLMSFLRITEGIQINSRGTANYLQVLAGSGIAYLFIDGKLIEPPELPAVTLNTTDIENVMSRRIFQPKPRRTITIIQVFTNDGYKYNSAPLFNEQIVKNGFDRPKKYYAPLYDFDVNRFSDWMAVDWKPILSTDKRGVVLIKVPKGKNRQNHLFSIQGFSEEGHLISELLSD